jgi:hypothetical protein
MNRTKLALELFNPDENGVSRWVSKNELNGKYIKLYPNNGNPWYRNPGLSHLIFEKKIVDKVIHWRFNGFEEKSSSRPIRKDIRDEILKRPCAHSGFKETKNNKLVVDHKNGRYNDDMVLSLDSQDINDFQPTTNQFNLFKRTHCNNVCIKYNIRFDAKQLGYDISFTEGNEKYDGTCKGCYLYDCLDFKRKISKINRDEPVI